MRNVATAAALALVLPLMADRAEAQMLSWQDRGFANFSLVAQSGPGDTPLDGSFELYEETGSFQGPWDVSAGAAIDIAAGYRVWRNLALGLGYSRSSDSSPVTLTVQVPDPLEFDRPHEQALGAGELDFSQSAVHISAVWFWPVTDKIDVALSAGPSIFNVEADNVTGVVVEPGTAVATGVTVTSASESTVGIHLGVDATYLITPRIGAGLLLRYAGGSVDLPSIDSLGIGGIQAGVGVRFRF